MDVSKNRGTPKSSILIGFSIINHPFWGTPIFGNTLIFAAIKLASLTSCRLWRLKKRYYQIHSPLAPPISTPRRGDSAQRAVVQSAKAFGKPKSLDSNGAEPEPKLFMQFDWCAFSWPCCLFLHSSPLVTSSRTPHVDDLWLITSCTKTLFLTIPPSNSLNKPSYLQQIIFSIQPIVMVVLHAEVAKIGPRSFRINNRFSKSNRPKDLGKVYPSTADCWCAKNGWKGWWEKDLETSTKNEEFLSKAVSELKAVHSYQG